MAGLIMSPGLLSLERNPSTASSAVSIYTETGCGLVVGFANLLEMVVD